VKQTTYTLTGLSAPSQGYFLDLETLIPGLASIAAHLTKNAPAETDPTFGLENLSYCLNCSFSAIHELQDIQHSLLTETPLRAGEIREVAPDDHHLMCFEVDRFLTSSRRALDALLAFVSKTLGTSTPESFASLCSKLTKAGPGDIVIDAFLDEQMLKYWEAHGRQLRSYRDLVIHKGNILSDGRMFLDENATPSIYLVLPDPGPEKSLAKLTYERGIHALPYVLREYVALLRLVQQVIGRLVAINEVSLSWTMSNHRFRGGVCLGRPPVGHSVADPDGLPELFERALGQTSSAGG